MAFNPSTIFDRIVLEADDVAGSDGDPITTWTKQSGTLTAPTSPATVEPSLKTNILNGKSVLRFNNDSPAEYMSFGDQAAMDFGTGAFSIFIVIKADAENQRILVKDVDAGTHNGIYIYTKVGDGFTYYNGTTEIVMGIRDSSYHMIAATRAGTGAGQLNLYYDGTAQTPAIEARNLSNSDEAYLGASADGAPSVQLDGDIVAIYIASSVPNATDRNLFGGYIQTKYGLTIAGATFASDPVFWRMTDIYKSP